MQRLQRLDDLGACGRWARAAQGLDQHLGAQELLEAGVVDLGLGGVFLEQRLVFTHHWQLGPVGVRHHLADAQAVRVFQARQLDQLGRVHHRDVVQLSAAALLAVALDEGRRRLVHRNHDDRMHIGGLDGLDGFIDLVGIALVACCQHQLEVALGQGSLHPRQARLAKTVVLVHHGHTVHAQGGELLHHVLGLIDIACAHMKDPGVERVAQRFAPRVRRHQRRTALLQHAVCQQLGDVGRARKAIQRHHLGLGQHLAGELHGVGHLVSVVGHLLADGRAVHAALGVHPVKVDLAAQHHLCASAGQHSGERCHLPHHNLGGVQQGRRGPAPQHRQCCRRTAAPCLDLVHSVHPLFVLLAAAPTGGARADGPHACPVGGGDGVSSGKAPWVSRGWQWRPP